MFKRFINFGSGPGGGGGGGGAAAGPAIAYAAEYTAVTSFGDDSGEQSLANRMELPATPAVNQGEFTLDDDSGIDRVVIPQDGNYNVTFTANAEASNSGITSARFSLWTQIVTKSGTDADVNRGAPAYGYARGRFYQALAFCSSQVSTIVNLSEGDLVWGAMAGNSENGSTTATVNGEIQIFLMEGAQGPVGNDGSDGDDGDDGATGATGATGDPGATGAQGIQGIPGIQGPTGADGSTDLSMTQTSTNVVVASSTGDDVTLLRATGSLAGVMAGPDKSKLDRIAFVSTGDSGQVLTIDTAGTATEWADAPIALPTLGDPGEVLTVNDTATEAEWAEDSRHINEFILDGEYERNALVRYQDVFYRANTGIDDADEVPAFDSDWAEISSHGIQGYGEVADELDVGLVITPTLSQPALGSGETRTTAVLFNPNSVLPQTILSPDDDGRLTAQVDGVEVKFDADDDYTLTVLGPTETGTTITLSIQVSENGGSFETIKSFSGALTFNGGPQVRSNPVDLSSDTDVTYSLDTDEYLDFQLVLTVGVGGLGTPNHVITTAGNHLSTLITGIVETRHILSHGIGDNAGMLVVEDSSDNSVTPIFEITGGVDMVAPTRLTGLVEDLSSTEKSSIQTKLGVSAGGDAVSVVAYSARGANQSSWYSSSWGQWSGELTSSVNDGSFTLSTDTNEKVIVPEDGVYEVSAVMYLNANNDDDGGTDFRPMLRIRRERSGSSTINLGQESGGHIRGNADDEGSRGTVTCVAVADLEDGDEIYTDARAWRQSSSTNATVSLDITLVKVGGAKGDTGSQGAQGNAGNDGEDGDDGADGSTTLVGLTDTPADNLGTTGQVLAVDTAGTATEWVDQSGGSGNVPASAVADAGRVLTVNDAGTDEDWGDLELELTVTNTADTVTVTGSVSSEIPAGGSGQQADSAPLPMSTPDLAGFLVASDKRIVDSVTPGATMIVGDQLAQLQLTEVTDTPNSAGEINYLVVDNDASDVRILVFLNDSDSTAVADTVGLLQIIDSGGPTRDGEFAYSRAVATGSGESKLVTFDGRWINKPSDPGSTGSNAATFYAAEPFSTGGGGLPTLGDAGQVLTVNTGETAAEWADATGGGGTESVVAYSSYSDTTSARDWRTESHAEVDNYDGNENVNIGSFTTATRDSVTDGAIVIPEDGTYSVRFGATATVGNTSGNAEYWGRVRLYVNGSKVRDGEVGHSRGQIISGSGNFDNLSTCEVSCILDLDEDDELHATFESDQQNNSTTATLEMKVDIHKIGGAKGATGAQGAAGATGAAGNDGNDGATGAQGDAGLQGIQGPAGNDGDDGDDGAAGADGAGIPDSSGASDGDVVTWDTSSSAAVWEASSGGSGTTNLAIGSRGVSTLDVTSSTGTDATVPAATALLTGLMKAEDKAKLDGVSTGAEVNVQSDWDATSGDALILNKPTPTDHDTAPSISFPGLPGQIDIHEGSQEGIGFHVYRNGSVMSRITTGTPTASQYLVTHTNTTGANSTFTYNLLGSQIDLTGISLTSTVANGYRAGVHLDFTFLGDDSNTFQVRKRIDFRRVDGELPGTLGTAGQVLEVNSGATGVEWSTVAAGNLPALGTAGQVLTVNDAVDASEWADASGLPDIDTTDARRTLRVNDAGTAADWGFADIEPPQNNVVRAVTHLAPGADFTTFSQIRQNANGTVSFTSATGFTNYAIAFDLNAGKLWQLRLNDTNYNIYRIISRTLDTTGAAYLTYTITVDLLRSEGTFSTVSTGDDLDLETYDGLVPAPVSGTDDLKLLYSAAGAPFWTEIGVNLSISGTSAHLYTSPLGDYNTPGTIPGPDADDAGLVPAVGDAGDVLATNSAETGVEWVNPETPVYRNGLIFSSTTGDGSWANRVTGSSTNGPGAGINRGGFTTVNNVGGGSIGSAIVIPSDGVYQITYTLFGNVDNDSSGGTSRSILRGRIQRVRSSTELELGTTQVAYSRGQYGSQFSEVSMTVTTVFGMEANDRVFLDTEITQQDNTRTMTLDGEVNIVKL